MKLFVADGKAILLHTGSFGFCHVGLYRSLSVFRNVGLLYSSTTQSKDQINRIYLIGVNKQDCYPGFKGSNGTGGCKERAERVYS